MAQQERADLHAAIELRFQDNTTEDITPADVRGFLHELVDSALLPASDTVAVDAYTKAEADTLLASKVNKQALTDLIGAAPAALDTLAEIANQLEADETGAAAMLATQQQHTQQLATLGVQASPVMAYLADTSVAGFVTLDDALAYTAKKKIFMEFHVAVLEILASVTGWAQFSYAAGTVIYLGDAVELSLTGNAENALNIQFARFAQKPGTIGGVVNIKSTASASTPVANLPLLNADMSVPLNLQGGSIQLTGTYGSLTGTGTVYPVAPFSASYVDPGVTVVPSGGAPAAPDAVLVLPFTPNLNLDFTQRKQRLSLLNNIVFGPAVNKVEAAELALHLYNAAASDVTLSFPSAWTFVGPRPAVLATGSKAVLTLACAWGSAESDITAGYAAEV